MATEARRRAIRKYREQIRDRGLVRVSLIVPEQCAERIKEHAETMRQFKTWADAGDGTLCRECGNFHVAAHCPECGYPSE